MKNRKRLVSFLAGLMAAVMLLTLLMSILPTRASAASSSEIRKQINQLKKEKEEIKDKISDVKDQYKANENEIADIIAKKNVIDQEIQLLSEQLTNMNDQLSAYNLLIADKQDELDNAEGLYDLQAHDPSVMDMRGQFTCDGVDSISANGSLVMTFAVRSSTTSTRSIPAWL